MFRRHTMNAATILALIEQLLKILPSVVSAIESVHAAHSASKKSALPPTNQPAPSPSSAQPE